MGRPRRQTGHLAGKFRPPARITVESGKRVRGLDETNEPLSRETDHDERTESYKVHNALPLRCPFIAARPESEGTQKCRDWHNASIAAVTRHGIGHVEEGSEYYSLIRALSSAKLSAEDRWRRYFVIFNDGVEDAEMNQPYWISIDPDDTMREILKILIARSDSGTNSSATLQLLHQYQILLSAKEKEDRDIRAQCEAEKAAAVNKEAKALHSSQAKFSDAFQGLMDKLGAESLSKVTGLPYVVPEVPETIEKADGLVAGAGGWDLHADDHVPPQDIRELRASTSQAPAHVPTDDAISWHLTGAQVNDETTTNPAGMFDEGERAVFLR